MTIQENVGGSENEDAYKYKQFQRKLISVTTESTNGFVIILSIFWRKDIICI